MGDPYAEAEAEVTVKAGEDLVRTIELSLRPEIEKPTSSRSRASIKAEGTILELRMEASDVTALRAALNSYLRWVQSINDVVKKARQDRPR